MTAITTAVPAGIAFTAALSLLVLAGWAALATAVSIRVFTRSAVH